MTVLLELTVSVTRGLMVAEVDDEPEGIGVADKLGIGDELSRDD